MWGSPSIRSRIVLFLSVISAAGLIMGVAAYTAIKTAEYYLNRVQWAHNQLEAITELDVASNRYSEQIAEMLLIGRSQQSDLESAKVQVEASIEKLMQATRGEIAFVVGRAELEQEIRELDVVDRLRRLHRATNRTVEELFALRDAGRQDEAVRLFGREIEERLDDEIQTIIADVVTDERGEVAAAEREAAAVLRRMVLLVIAVALAAVAVSVLSGYLLHRSLARPIRRLTEGAIALGRGDLSHRIGDAGRTELGLLAARFDDMAGQLTAQHNLLLAAQADLEAQVRQRTAELEEANWRLREHDRQRIQFLAEISHELRTPLTVLRGEAEVTLRTRALPEASYRETLERVADQARDMAMLVDDLLFLTRAETDTIRLQHVAVNLCTVLAEAVREADLLAASSNLAIDAVIPETPAVVEGDRQRLKQAMMIVLDNAVKYSEAGGTVRAGLAVVGDDAEITVRNRGAGIAPEDLPYVFERFYRGRGSGAQPSDGSGLGLPIAKWIIEKHGGSIALTSEPEGMTELRIRVPLGV